MLHIITPYGTKIEWSIDWLIHRLIDFHLIDWLIDRCHWFFNTCRRKIEGVEITVNWVTTVGWLTHVLIDRLIDRSMVSQSINELVWSSCVVVVRRSLKRSSSVLHIGACASYWRRSCGIISLLIDWVLLLKAHSHQSNLRFAIL